MPSGIFGPKCFALAKHELRFRILEVLFRAPAVGRRRRNQEPKNYQPLSEKCREAQMSESMQNPVGVAHRATRSMYPLHCIEKRADCHPPLPIMYILRITPVGAALCRPHSKHRPPHRIQSLPVFYGVVFNFAA